MNILIVGNTSALGKKLKNYLEIEHNVITAGRNDIADIYLDLQDINTLPEVFNFSIDVIINCAASFLGNSIIEACQNELINSVGIFKIMQLAELTNCKHIVNTSSISTYDCSENEYYGSYGLSKKHGDENLELFCKLNNVNYTSLLLTQLYDDKFELKKHQGMFYRMIEHANEGKDIFIYGKKDPLRNFLHVNDVVEIIKQVIEKSIFGTFDCVSPESYKLSEIANLAFKVFNKGGRVHFLEDQDDIRNIYIPNNIILFELLGYTPKMNLEQGMTLLKYEYEKRK